MIKEARYLIHIFKAMRYPRRAHVEWMNYGEHQCLTGNLRKSAYEDGQEKIKIERGKIGTVLAGKPIT